MYDLTPRSTPWQIQLPKIMTTRGNAMIHQNELWVHVCRKPWLSEWKEKARNICRLIFLSLLKSSLLFSVSVNSCAWTLGIHDKSEAEIWPWYKSTFGTLGIYRLKSQAMHGSRGNNIHVAFLQIGPSFFLSIGDPKKRRWLHTSESFPLLTSRDVIWMQDWAKVKRRSLAWVRPEFCDRVDGNFRGQTTI